MGLSTLSEYPPRIAALGAEDPAELVGAAAAADAAGDTAARDRLLERARRSEREHSTYYGAAWLALGRLMLTTDLLGGCRS